MRITGGKYCRRVVKFPRIGNGGEIRPAMDRMRESFFSILGDLDNMSFLDLFSGSGVVAIEAASRGASRIVLVERDRVKKATIFENLSFVEEDSKVFFMSVQKYLAISDESFDVIYLDPPFPMDGKVKLLKSICSSTVLKSNSIVILHYPEEDKIDDAIDNLICYDTRKYGRSILKFFKVKEV